MDQLDQFAAHAMAALILQDANYSQGRGCAPFDVHKRNHRELMAEAAYNMAEAMRAESSRRRGAVMERVGEPVEPGVVSEQYNAWGRIYTYSDGRCTITHAEKWQPGIYENAAAAEEALLLIDMDQGARLWDIWMGGDLPDGVITREHLAAAVISAKGGATE